MACVTPCAVHTTSLPIMSNAVPNLFEIQVGSLTIEPGMQTAVESPDDTQHVIVFSRPLSIHQLQSVLDVEF